MPRYIDADELLRHNRLVTGHDIGESYYVQAVYVEDIKSTPTADVAHVRRGEWKLITTYSTKAKYACSVCGRIIVASRISPHLKFLFCHCGANMRKEGD